MAGTIVVDRLESDASYASSINVASPLVVSNTISLGSAAAISGNVNIDSGLLFINAVGNRIGMNTTTVATDTTLSVSGNIKLNYTTVTNANARIYAHNSTTDPYVLNSSGGAGILFQRISGSDEIAFETHFSGDSHLERMRITKEGYVTKPFQPYIIAARSGSNFTTDGSTPIQFDTIINRVGITVSNSNSRFTVPVAGTYLICFNWFHTNPSPLDNAMTVLVNGANIFRFGTNNTGLSGSPANHGDGAAQMWYLNANDYIDIRGSGTKTVLGVTNPYHTQISIGKIY